MNDNGSADQPSPDLDSAAVTAAVTKVVDRISKPGREAELEAAIHALVQAALRFPGHLGATVTRPAPPSHPGFRLVYRFATEGHLRAWEESSEQHLLVARANRFTQGEPERRILTGLETWFTLPALPSEPPPARYKMWLVSWLGVFGLAYLIGLGQALVTPAWVPGWANIAINTGLTVLLMTYLLMPRLTRLFKFWLYPAESA